MNITLAQINPTVGDPDYNEELIDRVWEEHDSTSDLIVFPELVTTGYPPEDLLDNQGFLDRIDTTVERLTSISKNRRSAILIGTPRRHNGFLYNAALLIECGEMTATIHKHHLPNYGVFDEKRHFIAGPLPKPVEFRGNKLGFLICEDLWFPSAPAHLSQNGADILIAINASPFDIGKQNKRLEQARARIKETGLPIAYVNQVGGQDDLVFDGSSFVMDKQGEIVQNGKSFEEDRLTFNIPLQTGTRVPICPTLCTEETIFRAAALGLKDYLRKTGQNDVLIGLSGGIDSALTAAIAVNAIGKEHIHAVMMPSRFTSQESLDDAAQCAKNLGISYEIISISPMLDAFTSTQPDTSGIAHENLQSRLRGLILMTKSNMTGAMVLSTGNKSEMAMGYATLYGDMCGGYNPLKDIYKTQVYKVCTWLNETKNHPIPANILTKAPTAELRANQTDQDSLPPYDLLDAILERLIEQDLSIEDIATSGFDRATVEKSARLLKIAEYKRRQSALGPKITPRAFAKDRRYPVANGYKG